MKKLLALLMVVGLAVLIGCQPADKGKDKGKGPSAAPGGAAPKTDTTKPGPVTEPPKGGATPGPAAPSTGAPKAEPPKDATTPPPAPPAKDAPK